MNKHATRLGPAGVDGSSWNSGRCEQVAADMIGLRNPACGLLCNAEQADLGMILRTGIRQISERRMRPAAFGGCESGGSMRLVRQAFCCRAGTRRLYSYGSMPSPWACRSRRGRTEQGVRPEDRSGPARCPPSPAAPPGRAGRWPGCRRRHHARSRLASSADAAKPRQLPGQLATGGLPYGEPGLSPAHSARCMARMAPRNTRS
jgi:hypothetical protein